jgi:light-independent protochlorophyllide reductase subunit B
VSSPGPGVNVDHLLDTDRSRLPWYSRSVDSTYLTGKRVFIFGDATHVRAAARVAHEEMAFEVVGIGTYSREFARDIRAAAEELGVEALISDDYLAVEARIAELQPELVLGTQMERHIAKRLGIGCAVISAPIHVQDFPARYSPQMGFEGANVLFDTWVHPLVMGLEEHLLTMFRDDFEFNDQAMPSHLGHGVRGDDGIRVVGADAAPHPPQRLATGVGRRCRRTRRSERRRRWFSGLGAGCGARVAQDTVFRSRQGSPQHRALCRRAGRGTITVDTLYDAKAHYGR